MGSQTAGGSSPGAGARRATMLVCLAILCVLVLSPELRLFVDQQREIAALERDVAEHERAMSDLEDEVAAWSDDAYVAAQARERLRYVLPGETGYVTSPELLAQGDQRPDAPPGAEPGSALPPEGTWFDRVWSSIESAGTGAPDPVLDDPVVGEPGDE